MLHHMTNPTTDRPKGWSAIEYNVVSLTKSHNMEIKLYNAFIEVNVMSQVMFKWRSF